MFYVVTNREVREGESGVNTFGGQFNAKGYDELRLAKVVRRGRNWQVDLLPEKADGKTLPSERAFLELQVCMSEGRNCVFYVHGFNMAFSDVLDHCATFQSKYGVEVIAFTWPSDGAVRKYKSDKRDAVNSVGALDRTLELLARYLIDHRKTACGQNFSLLLHSMGNYLLKHLLKSSVYEGETLLFENVVLASADVNSADHAEWVDRIAYRHRLYITINEKDYALNASRMKTGEQQLVRLGHTTQDLSSRHAVYLDFTNAKQVGNSHTYFSDNSLKNPRVLKVFKAILNGGQAEALSDAVKYDVHTRTYQVL